MTNCIFVILDVFHVYWLLHTETAFFFFEMMSFVCHVEHPHKFISNYLATLETPPELRQEAWNLANDR